MIGLAGPYDFLPITDPKLKTIFGPGAEHARSQPIAFVDGDDSRTMSSGTIARDAG